MPSIRPISDLRNHFAEITREVHATDEPVFLTKNGVGSVVVMSMDAYENKRYESEVYDQLKEAELQARETAERRNHKEVMASARNKLREIAERKDKRA